MFQLSGKVLSSREAMRNKARPIPESGLDWHLEVEIIAWPDTLARPDGTLLVVVPGSVMQTMRTPPATDDLVELDATIDKSRPGAVRAHTLRRSQP